MSTTSALTAAQIRREFIDFFKDRHGHEFVPSSPVIPHNDPTLLFTNAGMNQFKDVFLGQGQRPYNRAANSQKCIRAGGKHNDLEDVGRDGYHHTFFEMLGNWSFGDYFKKEAIEWAWNLLVDQWGLDPDRIYATVFEGSPEEGTEPDTDAEEIWKRFVDPSRLSRWGKKDNFWEMGDTGPCGPCSEIHYDDRSDEERRQVPGNELVNRDHPNVIEIWNLVFIQFNRGPSADGKPGPLTPLPAHGVDTGMGLERVVRVMQGKKSNYDTDLWTPIFRAIEAHASAHPYGGVIDDPVDIAYRVIADHIRCLTVAISDGGHPGTQKANYVLRRILRRAVRHAHQTLGVEGAILYKLVPTVVETMGEAFPGLRENPEHVQQVIRDEEESFLRTLDRGLNLFDRASAEALGRHIAGEKNLQFTGLKDWARDDRTLGFVDAAGQASSEPLPEDLAGHISSSCPGLTLAAEDAFHLHTTFGFPIDLTRVMAEERQMKIDVDGYETLMKEFRADSGVEKEGVAAITLPPAAIARLKHLNVPPTDVSHRDAGRPLTARVEAVWNGTDFDEDARIGRPVAVVLSRTNHYAEAGGQVGDEGLILRGSVDIGSAGTRGSMVREERADFSFKVEDTQAFGEYVLHIGRVTSGELQVGSSVTVQVEQDHRGPTRANHTSTHLLNKALRDVIGDDVDQKGSLVAPDRLRFDFSCSHAMSNEQIAKAESIVSRAIEADLEVFADEVPLNLATAVNSVRAVFGERYPDPVRMVSIGVPIPELLADPDSDRWRDYSIEFCGGTHLVGTATAGRFAILREDALAAGVRRITAVTGPAAQAAWAAADNLEQRVRHAATLDGPALVSEVSDLTEQVTHLTLPVVPRHHMNAALEELRKKVKTLQKAADSSEREHVVEQARRIAEHASGLVIVEDIAGGTKDSLMAAMDAIRAKQPEAAVLLASGDTAESKVAIVAAVPKDLIGKGLKAGDWVKEVAKACGGGGGGRPDMAQAGGKDPSRLPDALQAAHDFAGRFVS